MGCRCLMATLACVACLAACDRDPAAGTATTPPATVAAASARGTADPAPGTPPGEWHSQARDYANTRYSPLAKIDRGNVARLRVAWTFSDGVQYGHEGAPLVVGDTMYVVSPYPNTAYALDLTRPGAPVKWSFDPHPAQAAVGKACCDAVLRGWAYAPGKLIYSLLDAHVVAVDTETGKQLWRTKMDNVEEGVTMTAPTFVVGNKVFVGNSGGEMGVSGWFAALDVDTGKELWRAYATGTDDKVLIGPRYKPFYPQLRGKDLGKTSWPPGMDRTGAGAAWAFTSYDPELNLIYYGTSNPGPRVPSQRPGDNLFSSAMFARDADTGEAVWAYQFTPHDQWDYDGVNEAVLLDLPIGGRTRKVLVHFDRNAYAYVIDRATGEVLRADPYAYQNWSTGFDKRTGRPIINPEKTPKVDQKVERICPPDIGQKDWQPSAYSPRTGLLYLGVFNLCMNLTDHKVGYIAGTPYDGMEMTRASVDGPDGDWGAFIAWDPVKGQRAWTIPEKFMVMSGALVTAGDVAFYGTSDGWFRAVDALDGKVLWQQKLASGIIGQPMTYLGPDGRQYVAIASGVGGAAGVQKNRKGYPPRGSTLYVFSLDGEQVTDPAAVPQPRSGARLQGAQQ